MITSPYAKYQQSSVQTATPSQLVVMMYDAAIRFTKLGIEGIEQQAYDKANQNLCKAQEILYELISSLDMNIEISKNLLAIYEYMNRQLVQANIKKKKDPAVEVLGYLQDLREAWEQAGKKITVQKPKSNYA